MLAKDYLEWSEVSGLYVRNYSHAERLKTYRPLLSEAGLNVVIAAGFLKDNPEVLDPVQWRSSSVYEFGGELRERLDLTAAALNAIGAPKMAAAVTEAKPASPGDVMTNLMSRTSAFRPMAFLQAFQAASNEAQSQSSDFAAACERRAEMETLLERYAQTHQADLAADVERHGDPRTRPGYTRAERMKELDELHVRLIRRESQKESVAELLESIADLKTRLADAVDYPKAAKRAETARKRFRKALQECRRIDPDDRTSEMTRALAAANALVVSRPDFFQEPVTKDDALNGRLAALGSFESDTEEGQSVLAWDSPVGFSGDWGTYGLDVRYPQGKTKFLARLIDAVEAIQLRLPELSAEWRRELVTSFRGDYLPGMDEAERAEYVDENSGDDADDVSNERILAEAGKGTIGLVYEEGELFVRTWFDVDWDPEHGYEIVWEVE